MIETASPEGVTPHTVHVHVTPCWKTGDFLDVFPSLCCSCTHATREERGSWNVTVSLFLE